MSYIYNSIFYSLYSIVRVTRPKATKDFLVVTCIMFISLFTSVYIYKIANLVFGIHFIHVHIILFLTVFILSAIFQLYYLFRSRQYILIVQDLDNRTKSERILCYVIGALFLICGAVLYLSD